MLSDCLTECHESLAPISTPISLGPQYHFAGFAVALLFVALFFISTCGLISAAFTVEAPGFVVFVRPMRFTPTIALGTTDDGSGPAGPIPI